MKNNRIIFQNGNGPAGNSLNDETGISPRFQKFIKQYQEVLTELEPKGEIATIHVDEIASKLAAFYEKIRKIIDWKEEHLIRRAAIERNLKRRLIAEISEFALVPNLSPAEMAEPLVLELIRGGYFANDQIPRKKLVAVQKILKKYVYILKNSPLAKTSKVKSKINLYSWILEIAACEIEEALDPPLKENLLIEFMTSSMVEKIQVDPGIGLSENEKRRQVYIAVHRTLFDLDSPIISYHLIKNRYPQWQNPDQQFLDKITKNILALWKIIDDNLSHPLSSNFQKICEKYDTLYLIIGDIFNQLSQEPAKMPAIIANPQTLENLIKQAYNKRLSTLKSRLFRSAVYSTLSIFLSNAVSLFIFEVPLAKLFYGRFSSLATAVDIVIPTLIMLFMVATVKPPKENNFRVVTKEIKKIVYPAKEKDIYEIRARKKRAFLVNCLIAFLYTLTSLFSLILVFAIFYFARVPATSIVIDTLNVAMIVFAGLLIRQRSKELTVEEKTTFWQFSLDAISIPVAKLGQWLSNKWKEYNIISIFFTALVDMPLTSFVEFVESWSLFLKEKKAEIH